jgi:hypothetical protein
MHPRGLQALKLLGLKPTNTQQAAEKVSSGPILVAQLLLAVRVLRHLTKAHSQEWLYYSIFSAAWQARTSRLKPRPPKCMNYRDDFQIRTPP